MKTLKYLVAIGLAVGIVGSVSAQPAGQTNYLWGAGGDKATWSQATNWVQNAVPPTDGTVFQIDTYNFSGNSLTPITLAPTDAVSINDAIFGPMWGQTLNVNSTVQCGFGEFIWGDLNGPVTTMNLFTNSALYLRDTLALGTAWWFGGGPNAVLNVYPGAQLGVTWMQFGARLNIYGGIVSVTNGFNTGTATTPVFAGGIDTDANRSINLAGPGQLILPTSYTATVNDWITRGILLVYGTPGDPSSIVIDEANTNYPGRTVVTTTATGPAALNAVRIEVPRTNLWVGGLEQAQVFADYSTTTNVNVTTSPNVTKTYESSNPGAVTITAGGLARAVGLGTSTLKVIVGSLSNTVSVTVTAYTNTTSLVHRYSFSDAPGSGTAVDSVGGSSWDSVLNGNYTQTGSQLELDGASGFAQFPPGILSGLDAVTIESWVTLGSISNWAVLWAFGDIDGNFGSHYITCQPHTAPGTAQIGISDADPGYAHEQDAFFAQPLDNRTNLYIAAVYHPSAGFLAFYTNGVLAGMNSNVTIPLQTALSTGNPFNYIGHSLYAADPYLPVNVDEFRIHNGPLTGGQIRAAAALGPNQLVGTATGTALSATLSGGNLTLRWPTNSALVTLMTTPALGAGAAWTEVTTLMSINGGNYQVTIPASSAAAFYRLQK
jgi:hypothetical protein